MTDKEIYELQESMRSAQKNKELSVLTFDALDALKGKTIETFYYGYMGQDGVDRFVVGNLKSEYQIAAEETFDEERSKYLFKGKVFANRAKYWESYMTKESIDRAKNKCWLYTADGRNTFIYCHVKYVNEFYCSDDGRYVYYRVVTNEPQP